MDCTTIFRNSVNASRNLSVLDSSLINKTLNMVAGAAIAKKEYIITENKKDLRLLDKSDSRYDRLLLTFERIESIASDIRKVSEMASPLDRVLMKSTRPNGLIISKITVPFGVVGVIYEARPNVTFDVFSLCLKSGNACILKGGSDAINSNTAIVKMIDRK